jgi:hypothetical protein
VHTLNQSPQEEVVVLGKSMEGFCHAALALAVFVLAVFCYEPWSLFTAPSPLQPSHAPGTLLSTDLQTIRMLIPSMEKMEESRPGKMVVPGVRAGCDLSPLNLWEELDPQASRYSDSFDYYLGFSY